MEPEPSLHLRHKRVDRLNSKWLKNASCTPTNTACNNPKCSQARIPLRLPEKDVVAASKTPSTAHKTDLFGRRKEDAAAARPTTAALQQ